jgi:queuine tRNA-ribosyltransferase
MFDCVIPTREGRHGKLFLAGKGQEYSNININNARFALDFTAINKSSKISELKNHSRSYLHHLFKLNELLGQKMASLNNLEFYQNILIKLRRS